ncbi:MAG: tRNA (adenosine(37)-N6)-threonylcarbamoyltransferase complex dimerization subunit type 1 TsaB [Salibacteraceae bacterium]
MAVILNMETSTTVCSVAIGVDGEVKSLKEINDGYSHAEQLEILISEVLKESDVSISNLDAISVSKGPGSYTGLRIGVSFAKGLCFGKNLPLISIPTLESMAVNTKVQKFNGFKVPMLDARRMEVFTCTFGLNHELLEETNALVLDETSYSNLLKKGSTLFFGPGMEKSKSLLATHKNAQFLDGVMPSAAFMVKLSEKKFKQRNFESVAYFEPYYLKDFVAGRPKKLL